MGVDLGGGGPAGDISSPQRREKLSMLRKMSNQKIETEIQQRWDRFHQWELEYEKERLKKLSPRES